MDKINIMLDEGACIPTRAHNADAGLDIYAPMTYGILLKAHESCVINTGVHIEIPEGYVGYVKSKSGLYVKHSIITTGTIDSGYTGSIVVKLCNLSDEDYTIQPGDKITQIVIHPIVTPEPVIVETFKETERGDNGFGSTGK